MTMLVVLTVILSPQVTAQCEAVVKACDTLVFKQQDLIQIMQQRNDDLDRRLEELQNNYDTTRAAQGVWLLGGVVTGMLVMNFLRAK